MSRAGAAELGLEESIIERCKSRDAEAFGLLVDKYQARVYGYVRRMLRDTEEAEDVAQEVFVKAFQHISRFDGRASVGTWLFKIASNLCIDRSRRKEKRPETVSFSGSAEREYDKPDGRWDPQASLVAGEMEKTIEAAIGELSDKLRSVLLLHDLEGLSYDEIAQAAGIPVGTVKSRLFLARTHLQNALAGYLAPEETR